MALFFLTNCRGHAETTQVRWSNLFSQAEILELNPGVYLTLSNAFRSKKIVHLQDGLNQVFGFGTFFSERGFHEEALSSVDIVQFTEDLSEEVFGHYVFLIKSKSGVRIVTDPVGMINVFWSQQGDTFSVSNDINTVAATLDDLQISPIGTQQFVLNESTLGSVTIFEKVSRLKYRHELFVSDKAVDERIFYQNKPIKMNYLDYKERVEKYFKLINNYQGRITTDLSAGYDTRLIAACASPFIPKLQGMTNENKFDHGIDVAIATKIANRLKIPLEIIKRKSVPVYEEQKMLHLLSVGRDVIASRAWIDFCEKKYINSDLILGGYGGEILRAKYSTFRDTEDFCHSYYNGRFLKAWGLTDLYPDYLRDCKKILETEYEEEAITDQAQRCNFWYGLDRMRIWGGSANQGFQLYGDRLHPFMDWYLMGPIFTFPIDELRAAKLQEKLIEQFSPGLMELPINPKGEVKITERVEKLMTRIMLKVKVKDPRKLKEIYRIVPRNQIRQDVVKKSRMDMPFLESSKTLFLSRFLTVNRALTQAREMNRR